jgi:hypothetical protein
MACPVLSLSIVTRVAHLLIEHNCQRPGNCFRTTFVVLRTLSPFLAMTSLKSFDDATIKELTPVENVSSMLSALGQPEWLKSLEDATNEEKESDSDEEADSEGHTSKEEVTSHTKSEEEGPRDTLRILFQKYHSVIGFTLALLHSLEAPRFDRFDRFARYLEGGRQRRGPTLKESTNIPRNILQAVLAHTRWHDGIDSNADTTARTRNIVCGSRWWVQELGRETHSSL